MAHKIASICFHFRRLTGAYWVFVAFIALSSASGGEVQHVSGLITKDAVWTGEVLVTDDVIVGRNEEYSPATLTIENATVRFARRASLLVHTRIVAKNVVFTSAEEQPAPGDWNGVRLAPPVFGNLASPPDPSRFENCTIEYASTGLDANYRLANTKIEVTGCRVRKCRWGGILMEGVAGGVITGNEISEICLADLSAEGRPLAFLNSRDCKVTNNSIRNCSDSGIALTNCQKCLIEKNSIEQIKGGPHGSYKAWGMGISLLNSDENRILGNRISDVAYMAIWVAYGSDRNVVQGNQAQSSLAGITVTGTAEKNEFRGNRFSWVGWSVLYSCGPDENTFENCNIDHAGYCFTARTGRLTFSNCDWRHTARMNFWGDSHVTVDRCTLKDGVDESSVNLQDQSEGVLLDCEFDKNAMTASPDSTGGIDVKYGLRIHATDRDTGADIPSFRVVVQSVDDASEKHELAQKGGKPARFELTEFRFDKNGKHFRAPYKVKIEAAGYEPETLTLAMDQPTQKTVQLARKP